MLSEKDKKNLLGLSRAILNAFDDGPADDALMDFEGDESLLTEMVEEPMPCFVTLKTKAGKLRGCIGTLETDEPLYANVFEYTRMAAFQDPRFTPVTKKEVKDIVLSISVLSPVEELTNFDLIEVGKHGLVVSHGEKRGVLLASVAKENKFDKDAFIKATCEKAGLAPADYKKYKWQYFEEVSFSE